MDENETPLPVLFRKDISGDVTAIFPTLPWDRTGDHMACYSHVGQHSSCSVGWYNQTSAASPDEYAALKAELEGAPFNYRFDVRSRISRAMHETRRRDARK